MSTFLKLAFGAKGQIVVGIFFLLITGLQTMWWLWLSPPPTATAIFIVSMEALAFAAYGIISGALGYRATERVEEVVIEHMDVDVDVEK